MADPLSIVSNPFAALGAVAGPAVLTNACSVLAMGTSNRLGRVVDRTRVVVRELRDTAPDGSERPGLLVQLDTLEKRSTMLLAALRDFYTALGLFAAAALLSALGSVLGLYSQSAALFNVVAVLALSAGVIAVASLVRGCVVIATETRLAVQQLQEEARGRAELKSQLTGRASAS
jgi:hypothetical protein